MPTVPRFDTPQVAPPGPSNARFDAPQARNFAPQQTMQMGQAVEGAGLEAGRQLIDTVAQANELRVTDALNQVKEAQLRLTYDKDQGYTRIKGINALERPDGKQLHLEYAEQFKKSIGDVEATLGNDVQKQAFRARAGGLLMGFAADVQRHENQEMQTYTLSVSDGVIATARREMALNPTNFGVVDGAVERIKAETYRQAQLLSKSAEWQEAQVRKMTSDAHKLAVQQALENSNPMFAEGYLKKYAGQMEADDILQVRGQITKQMDAQVASGVASQVVQQVAPKLAPTDMDRMVNITMATESNGRRYGKDGALLASPKGALGEMQVMPATAKNPGFGVRPAQNDSPEELARVGRDMLGAMLQRYKGDMALAWAAYNAGPGRVDDAIKRAEKSVELNKNDPTVQVRSVIDFMPKETQTYVAKNIAAFSGGQGAPAKPTLADIDAQLQSNPAIAGNPARLKLAREEAARQFKMQEDAINQRGEDAVAEAQKQLIANGGNYAGLPASVRNSLPPGKVDDVIGFAGRISKGAPIETDWSLYYELKTDPAKLQATNLMAFRSKLGDAEFKALVSQQEDLRSGKDMTRLRSFGDVLNQYMREAGIDPTPKDTDTTGAAKVGRIWSAFEARVREREQAKGSKLTPEEIQKTAAQLFTKVGISGLLWDSEKPAVMLAADDKITKIPDEDRTQIIEALRANRRPVTEQNIIALFRRGRGLN